MKIIGVGMNYGEWDTEEPVIFTKCDSALLKDGKPFFIPDFARECLGEAGIVVHLCRMGKEILSRFAYRYYDMVTVGVDFTAETMMHKAREQGLPWDMAKGFDGSAVIGEWISVEGLNVRNMDFRLDINGNTVQSGNTSMMRFSVDEIIAYVSRFCMLRQGDLIFTGGVSARTMNIGEHLEGYLGSNKVLDFCVK